MHINPMSPPEDRALLCHHHHTTDGGGLPMDMVPNVPCEGHPPHRFSSVAAMARYQTPTQPEGGETLTQEQTLGMPAHRAWGPHPCCAPSSAAPIRAGPQLPGEGLGQESRDWSGRGPKWSEFSFVKMVPCHWGWWDDAGGEPR